MVGSPFKCYIIMERIYKISSIPYSICYSFFWKGYPLFPALPNYLHKHLEKVYPFYQAPFLNIYLPRNTFLVIHFLQQWFPKCDLFYTSFQNHHKQTIHYRT